MRRKRVLPSVNLVALIGVQSLGIKTSPSLALKSAVRASRIAAIFNTQRLKPAARCRAEYDASVAIYNATLSNALRQWRMPRQPQVTRWGTGRIACGRRGGAEAHEIVSKRYQANLQPIWTC